MRSTEKYRKKTTHRPNMAVAKGQTLQTQKKRSYGRFSFDDETGYIHRVMLRPAMSPRTSMTTATNKNR